MYLYPSYSQTGLAPTLGLFRLAPILFSSTCFFFAFFLSFTSKGIAVLTSTTITLKDTMDVFWAAPPISRYKMHRTCEIFLGCLTGYAHAGL